MERDLDKPIAVQAPEVATAHRSRGAKPRSEGEGTLLTDTGAARALQLFGLFAASRRSLTLTEISERLNAPKSSCFQLVRTLQHAGYLYALGPRRGFYPTKLMVYQAQTIAQHDPIHMLIERQLLDARDRTGESVVVSSLHEGLALIIDLLESPQGIRFSARIGERRPLHSSSLGRALLGEMTVVKRNELLDRQERDYPGSQPIDRAALEAELALAAKRGWHLSKEEVLGGVTAVAISVTAARSKLAVAVAGPSERMNPSIEKHAAALIRCFAE
jgi:IclR family transcriptional regulator, acetate operon repressor